MALELTFAPGALFLAGIGRVGTGVAKVMARAGVPVVFTYRSNAERAQKLAQEIAGENGKAMAIQLDMADSKALASALDQAAEFGGGLRHVVSALGPLMPFDRMADIDEAALLQFFIDDGMAATRLAQQAVKIMRSNGAGGGSITFCTTIANYRIVTDDGASPFSKGAVEAVMRQIASEEAIHAIRANSVAVSWVNDETRQKQLDLLKGLPADQFAIVRKLVDVLDSQTPLGRPASSDEAGWLFAFLASEQASYITGQTVKFDGGFSLGGTIDPR